MYICIFVHLPLLALSFIINKLRVAIVADLALVLSENDCSLLYNVLPRRQIKRSTESFQNTPLQMFVCLLCFIFMLRSS